MHSRELKRFIKYKCQVFRPPQSTEQKYVTLAERQQCEISWIIDNIWRQCMNEKACSNYILCCLIDLKWNYSVDRQMLTLRLVHI